MKNIENECFLRDNGKIPSQIEEQINQNTTLDF